jgi:hypothetical protein
MTNKKNPYPSDLYKLYTEVIKEELRLGKEDWNFKSNHYYRGILEHVSPSFGEEFLSEIIKNYNELYYNNKDYLIELCHLNDLYGKTIKHDYKDFTNCSPSNLRYILHSLLLLDNIKNNSLDKINFIEIGGGYGGLAFFVNKLAKLFNIKINSYTMFDLHEAALLQQKYSEAHNIKVKASTLDNCGTLHKDSFLISNYALSEISPYIQKEYTEKILNNYISHGFLVWNFPDLFGFKFYKNFTINKSIAFYKEYPLTGKNNLYVYIKPKIYENKNS